MFSWLIRYPWRTERGEKIKVCQTESVGGIWAGVVTRQPGNHWTETLINNEGEELPDIIGL